MHTCSCGKKYKRLGNFQRHRAFCEMRRFSANSTESHLLDQPSTTDLWLVVQVLLKKVTKLENTVAVQKKWICKQKKKLNLMDWLNGNCTPRQDYITWARNVEFTRRDLHLFFDHNFVGGMYRVLEKNLSLNDGHLLPIRAFDQKLNTLFAYSEGQWRQIDQDEFRVVIGTLYNELKRVFHMYRLENASMIDNPVTNETYLNNLRKVMGGPYEYDVSISKISCKLYNHLKLNLKKIVEYEFTF